MERFDQVYSEHFNLVLSCTIRCIGRRDVAEEIVADAFLEFFRRIDQVKDAQLPAWLIRVAKNRAIDYWRKHSLEERSIKKVGSVSLLENEKVRNAKAMAETLLRSQALKPVHRMCLVLCYYFGMDRVEIAELTGMSENQVKGYLQYARTLLRNEFGDTRAAVS